MEQDKTRIRLQLLYDQVKQYQKTAFFSVSANNPEVLNLWVEYNEIRGILSRLNPELFADLKEIIAPEPEEASSFGRHNVGEPVFKPMHFNTLERQIEKALEYMTLLQPSSFDNKKEVLTGDININALSGSMVNFTIGDNNQTIQNSGQIDQVLKDLEGLGVDKDEIATLQGIIKESNGQPEQKEGVWKKIFRWFGGVTRKVIEKGLAENIPAIVDKAKSLLDYL